MDNDSLRFGDISPKMDITKKLRYQKDKLTQKLKDHNSKARRWGLVQSLFPAHLDAITEIKSIGDWAITGSYNGEVSLWGPGDRKGGEILKNSLNTTYRASVLSMDIFGGVVAGGLGNGSIFIAECGADWERPEWHKSGMISVDKDPLNSVKLVGESRCIACGLGGDILCVDLEKEAVVAMTQTRHPLKCMDKFSESVVGFGGSVVYSGTTGSISVWDTRKAIEDVVVLSKPHVNCCTIKTLPDIESAKAGQPIIYAGTNDNYIKCYDLRRPSQVLHKILTSAKVSGICISDTKVAGPNKGAARTLMVASQTNAKAKLFSLECELVGVCETDPERGALLSCAFLGTDFVLAGGVDRALYVYKRHRAAKATM